MRFKARTSRQHLSFFQPTLGETRPPPHSHRNHTYVSAAKYTDSYIGLEYSDIWHWIWGLNCVSDHRWHQNWMGSVLFPKCFFSGVWEMGNVNTERLWGIIQCSLKDGHVFECTVNQTTNMTRNSKLACFWPAVILTYWNDDSCRDVMRMNPSRLLLCESGLWFYLTDTRQKVGTGLTSQKSRSGIY